MRDVPDVHNTLFAYPRFNVDMFVTLTTELPGVQSFLGTRGLLEVREDGIFVTQQDGEDHSPSYYSGSFPKRLREPYQKQWQQNHEIRPGTQSAAESISYHTPDDYDVTREHLWNFFQAVRSRQPVVEDTVFGNHTAIACHMANASYFKKTTAVWDAGPKSIKTA